MSLVPWKSGPDPVIPFVDVLQGHGGVVLHDLREGRALVEDHPENHKLEVCTKSWVSIDCAEEGIILLSNMIPNLTMLIRVRMY